MSGSVEPVSGQCRLTLVSEVSGSVGAGVGLVSGLLDRGSVRFLSRSVGVSGCRSVGVSGCVGECRRVGVSECRVMVRVDDVGAGAMCRWGYWLHSCTSHCLASMFIANLHATPITCQLCILQSLPPLQKQLEFWGLAFLAGLHAALALFGC